MTIYVQPPEEAAASLLPALLRPGLEVVFIGAAASLHSARAGHWYAGPNRFYLLLYQAGFTPRRLEPEEDGLLPEFGIGVACLYPRLASSANHLLPEPTADRRDALLASLREAAPRVLCYNGKDVYRMCHGVDAPRWGLLPEPLGVSRQFVVISTSGRADAWGAERLFLFQELKRLVEAGRPG
jgi:mismatch-specific thymine-DNA glycosylase